MFIDVDRHSLQMDTFLIASPRWHSMQRGNKIIQFAIFEQTAINSLPTSLHRAQNITFSCGRTTVSVAPQTRVLFTRRCRCRMFDETLDKVL